MIPALACFLALGGQLDGDTYHYAEYWKKLVNGVQHVSSLHEAAPKAVPIAYFGLAWQWTGSLIGLTLASILSAGVGAALLARWVHQVFGRPGARLALLLIALHPLFIRQALEGSSVLLEIVFLAAALLAVRGERIRPALVGGLLVGAGLCRPEVWPLYLMVLGVAAILRAPRDLLWTFAVASMSPLAWLAFDGLLTGDPFFSFRDTANYAERHTGIEAPTAGLLSLSVAYVRRFGSIFLRTSPGALPLLGFVGWLMLARIRPRQALVLLAAFFSVFGFYLLPFRSGLPLPPRFLLMPSIALTALAGPALLSIAGHLRGKSSKQPLLHRASGPIALTLVALLSPLYGLQEWARGTGTLFAAVTREHAEACEHLAQETISPQDRFLVSARRKGMVVLLLGLDSDQVTSFKKVDSEDLLSGREKIRFIFYDPRDIIEPESAAWSFLTEVPPGYHLVDQGGDSGHLKVYEQD